MGRQVEKIGQRRISHVETASPMPASEDFVDHRFDDRIRLVQQQDLEDSNIGRRDAGNVGEVPETPCSQVRPPPCGGPSLMAQGFPEFLPAAFRQAGIGSIARAVPGRAARRSFLPGVEFQKHSVFDDPGHKVACRRISFVEPFDGIYDIGNHEITLVGPKHRLSPLAGCRVTISHRYVRCGRVSGAATGRRPRDLLHVAHVATLFETVTRLSGRRRSVNSCGITVEDSHPSRCR